MVSQQEDSSANLRRLLASTKLQALRPKPQEPVVLRYEHTVEHVLEVCTHRPADYDQATYGMFGYSVATYACRF